MASKKSARPRRRTFLITSVLALVVALFTLGAGAPAGAKPRADQGSQPTIVLVHGDWADGSSTWARVIERLQERDFTVDASPNLLRGLVTDAPYLSRYLQTIPGPIVLVAHSYGGFVVTNAATGNPNVKALVYPASQDVASYSDRGCGRCGGCDALSDGAFWPRVRP